MGKLVGCCFEILRNMKNLMNLKHTVEDWIAKYYEFLIVNIRVLCWVAIQLHWDL
jgi:hypothetical protein